MSEHTRDKTGREPLGHRLKQPHVCPQCRRKLGEGYSCAVCADLRNEYHLAIPEVDLDATITELAAKHAGNRQIRATDIARIYLAARQAYWAAQGRGDQIDAKIDAMEAAVVRAIKQFTVTTQAEQTAMLRQLAATRVKK